MLSHNANHCHEDAVMWLYLLSWRRYCHMALSTVIAVKPHYSLSWKYSPLSWCFFHTTLHMVMKMLSHYTTHGHEDAITLRYQSHNTLPMVMMMLSYYATSCHEDAITLHYPWSWRCCIGAHYSMSWSYSTANTLHYPLSWRCCKVALFIVVKILPFIMKMLSHCTTYCHEDAVRPHYLFIVMTILPVVTKML